MVSVERIDSGWIVAANGPEHGQCPGCKRRSTSRHSRYVRTLNDLSAFGATVALKVRASRWRCKNDSCAVKFFADSLPDVARFRGRRTCRANEITRLVGYLLGGRAGERLIGRLGIAISDDSILRELKKSVKPIQAAEVVGLDEWAKRKGFTYGTIVVDLERNQVVDVLDTHSTAGIENWLSSHPEVRIICRDRNGRYARAGRNSLPKALQVADRFHLLVNLRNAIERELQQQRQHLRVPSTNVAPSTLMETSHRQRITRRERTAESTAVQEAIGRDSVHAKLNLFNQVKQLQAAGENILAISRRLGVNRRRLYAWAKLTELPSRSRMEPREGSVEIFRDYLHRRWEEGHRNGRQLYDEITAIGYKGAYKTLARILSPWRHAIATRGSDECRTQTTVPARDGEVCRQVSPQFAAYLMGKAPPALTPKQRVIVEHLKTNCPNFLQMRALMNGFRSILTKPKEKRQRVKKIRSLERWMKRARATGIPSILQFLNRLRRDITAVEGAVSEPWSNGPVEDTLIG